MTPERYRDYDRARNGLQVESRGSVRKIAAAVDCSLATVRLAAASGANLMVVHHGLFWSETRPWTGPRMALIRALLEADMAVYSMHLPLDAHPELGNNVSLARILGLPVAGCFLEQDLGMHGEYEAAVTLDTLAQNVRQQLGRVPLVIGQPDHVVRRVAWCTGAAQSSFEDAIRLGVDAYITGEISEQSVHLARETGVAFVAAGHHATERYGIHALGDHLAERFGLNHAFIDIDNPV